MARVVHATWYDVTREMERLRTTGRLESTFSGQAPSIRRGLEEGHRIVFSPESDAHYVLMVVDEIFYDPAQHSYGAVRRI